jgi:hypothetical protein
LIWLAIEVDDELARGEAAGRGADGQAVVGKGAAVVEQSVDAQGEAAGVADVELAVEGQGAADVEHAGGAGRA